MRQPLCTFLLVSLAALGCRGRPPSDEWTRPAVDYGLHVLHVGSERSVAAGYALDDNMVVTSAHLFEHEAPVAAVEGAPMLAGNLLSRVSHDRHALPRSEDWVLLAGEARRFDRNKVDPAFRPRPGQTVLVAGFPLAGRRFTRRQLWDVPARVVEGKALCEPPSAAWQKGLVLVEAPSANYGGFSGGPAACIGEDGKPVVWGTFVCSGYHFGFGKRLRFVLGIVPLPGDLLPMSIWRSYSK